MSRYGSKPPDALPNGVVTTGGRYGRQTLQKEIKPIIFKTSIDVNGELLMKDDRHEVFIHPDNALYVDIETYQLKCDINGGA